MFQLSHKVALVCVTRSVTYQQVCDIRSDKLRRLFISLAPDIRNFFLRIQIIHDVISPQYLLPSSKSNKHMAVLQFVQ